MQMIDTHLHTIDLARLRYPWLAGVEALNRDFSYSTWQAEARRCGITGALHMEVDVADADIETETTIVAAHGREKGSLLRGAISACRPEHEDFLEFLERQRANPFVKGFRRILHTQDTSLSKGARFRANISWLKGTGLPFDLCVLPHQIPVAQALVDLNPDVQFVLDHCGVPDIKGKNEHPWRENMTEIARRPNVAAKISGICAYADSDWGLEDLRPYVEHTISVFGWDRVVWGSDWPVCTLNGTLSTWVAATHALLAGCSADERARLLAENAKKIWKLA